ncbi:MAG: methyltransferase [bacterium]
MPPQQPETAEQVRQLSTVANAYRQSILLLTANRSDLFTRLSGKTLSAEEIGALMSWDQRAAEVFLNALTAMGYLNKVSGLFSNTVISEQLLVKGKPDYQGDILNHNLHLWERWARVGEVLPSGESLRDPLKRRSGDELRAFIGGMANIARFSSILLWEKVDLTGYHCLLDLGGGPGTYSFAACRQFPQLSALVYDLSEVEEIFEEQRQQADMEDRVRFHAGDFNTDAMPEGCDAVLLSNIIHSWSTAGNLELLRKIQQVMLPSGLLIIKDFFISEDGTQPLFSALFAVNMLLGTEAGGCYSRKQVQSWLEEAGFEFKDYLELTEQAGVILARRNPCVA